LITIVFARFFTATIFSLMGASGCGETSWHPCGIGLGLGLGLAPTAAAADEASKAPSETQATTAYEKKCRRIRPVRDVIEPPRSLSKSCRRYANSC
jgi:hypothetical protein